MIRPYMQPDGGIVEIDSEVQKALTQGYPPLGWEGDIRLFLAWNRATQRMELWRNCEDGVCRLIVQSRPGQRLVDMNLIHFLVSHVPRRGFDPAAEVVKANAAAREAAISDQHDRMGEAAERLYWGLQKDIGHTITGSTRDYQPLPDAPWKKDKDGERDSAAE